MFDEENFLKDIAEEIAGSKTTGCRWKNLCLRRWTQEHFGRYTVRMKKDGSLSGRSIFDDMLVVCYELFRSRPDILAMWQKKFRYILVDEFQDITACSMM